MLKAPYIRYFGRVLADEQGETIYMDWSLCGFEVLVSGKSLTITLSAGHGIEPSSRFGRGTEPQRPLWPMVGIIVGDHDAIDQTVMIDAQEKTICVAVNAEPGRGKRVRMVKLTENIKSHLALTGIACDGAFLALKDEPGPVMEIIGDSITCGFGNESPSPLRTFYAEEENGWMAYGAITARNMGMTPQIVASSGICLAMKEWNGRPYAMRDLYEYTDRPREDGVLSFCPDSNMALVPQGLPETRAQKWDFTQHPVHTVIINLGTNDADACNYYDDAGEKAKQFEKDYIDFIRMVRRCNGPDTKIVCALGDMRYFLWEHIRAAVETYMAETGDTNIGLIKLNGIRPGEARGAGSHPSVATDRRMAAQLTAYLKNI